MIRRRKRQFSLWLAALLAFISCTLLALRLLTHPALERNAHKYITEVLQPLSADTLEGFSDHYRTTRLWLRNDIERRLRWTDDDAVALRSLIETYPLDAPPPPDEVLGGDPRGDAKDLAIFALVAIGERMFYGAPIDPHARDLLRDTMYRYSYAADPSIRLLLANLLCYSGLIFEDKRIHDRVVEMIRDPDPEVAMNARRHYTWHTATLEARERLRRLGATRWQPEGGRGGDDDG